MRTISLLLLLLLVGCASPPANQPRKTFRQTVGRPIANVGGTMGDVGTTIMIVSVHPVFIILCPVGLAIGIPICVAGLPLYYGGNALAGEESGSYPPGY